MSYVYILESVKNKKRYVGGTRLNPKQRLKQHNSESNEWSRANKPFKLLHVGKYSIFTEARKRENYLKTTNGKRLVNKLYG